MYNDKVAKWLKEKGYHIAAHLAFGGIDIEFSPENLVSETRALVSLLKEHGFQLYLYNSMGGIKISPYYHVKYEDSPELAGVIITGLTDEMMRDRGIIL